MAFYHCSSFNWRYLLKPNDHKSLYRRYYATLGILLTENAHKNLHELLTPSSPRYQKQLAESICGYKARTNKHDRLEVIICTKPMVDAAWKFAHVSPSLLKVDISSHSSENILQNKQIVMDGTFGFCYSKLLVFIVLAIDTNKKGIPLCMML